MKHGACIDKKDVDGLTILHKAYEKKYDQLIFFLLETYPQLQDITDNKGRLAKDLMTTVK